MRQKMLEALTQAGVIPDNSLDQLATGGPAAADDDDDADATAGDLAAAAAVHGGAWKAKKKKTATAGAAAQGVDSAKGTQNVSTRVPCQRGCSRTTTELCCVGSMLQACRVRVCGASS